MDNKRIVIYGGGTVSHVRNHLALCAPAYGSTARRLAELTRELIPEMDTDLRLTRMAGGSDLETPEDIDYNLKFLLIDDLTKVIIMNAAIVDYTGTVDNFWQGRHVPRLKTSEGNKTMDLVPTDKIISKIRKHRKDIFLVGFKATCGVSEDEQYIAGLDLCKKASCNLVFCNDTLYRRNLIVTPEEARYHVTHNRDEALRGLVNMIKLRSHLTFTRSTVVAGSPVPWGSPLVPTSLRTIVDYCISKNAYKPFNGATVGHFAHKLNDNTFLTSIRKSNFNDLDKNGLVKVVTDGPDTVIAYGARPSVGGQSQRIIFNDHPGLDCVVHFHCPIREGSKVPVRSQYEVECGSHECGKNTSEGLARFGNLWAVYLDNHGPNIVFNKDIDPQEVINFIEENFDLSEKTGGFVSIKERLETPNTLEFAQSVL